MLTRSKSMASAHQSGLALLESMLAVLIISIGILAIVGMQASAVQATTDTRFRAEAAYQVDKLIGQMLINIDRTSSSTMQSSINTFLHNTADGTDSCTFDGSAASNTIVNSWITSITGSSGLPGTTTDHIQIKQDTTANAGNRLIVTVRWISPWETLCHQQVTVAYIN
jgi:type IV pilus assembly protein PilV